MRWGIYGNYRSGVAGRPSAAHERLVKDRMVGSLGESFALQRATLQAWMHDIRDAQRSDGNIPDVAPAF